MNSFRLSHLIVSLSTVGVLAGVAWLLIADGARDAGFHPSHPIIFISLVGLVWAGLRARADRRRAGNRA